MLRIVDLPAPLGPSRAVTPGPIPNVRSETATTSPYHLLTPLRAMTAFSPGARPGRLFGTGSFVARVNGSFTAAIPGDHHHAANRYHRHHDSQRRVQRNIDAPGRHIEQGTDHRSDRAGRADSDNPSRQVWLIPQCLR